MLEDPIVAEVRRIRDELAARFNYDLDAIVRDARKRQKTSGHKVVNLGKRRRGKQK
ncbi:MAG TPA: hypothetical protein VGP72_01675 [Planctomycetota bacterium]|jgi:hypothetical protein